MPLNRAAWAAGLSGLVLFALMAPQTVGGEPASAAAGATQTSAVVSPIDRLLEPSFIREPGADTFALSHLLGVRVRNFDGDVIGVVEDVLVSPGGFIRGVVIGYGGFFGMDRKRIAVPWSEIRTGSGSEAMLLIGIDRRALDAAPVFVGSR